MSQRLQAVNEQTTQRERVTWYVAPLVTVGLFLLVQTGTLIFWAGRVSVTIERHERDLSDVAMVRERNAALQSKYEALEGRYARLDEYVGLLVVYEGGLREKLLPITTRYRIELPPMPERPRER